MQHENPVQKITENNNALISAEFLTLESTLLTTTQQNQGQIFMVLWVKQKSLWADIASDQWHY